MGIFGETQQNTPVEKHGSIYSEVKLYTFVTCRKLGNLKMQKYNLRLNIFKNTYTKSALEWVRKYTKKAWNTPNRQARMMESETLIQI